MQIYTIPFAVKSGDSFSVCLAVDRLWERVDECRNISKQRRGREKEPEDSSAKSEGHCAKAKRAGSECVGRTSGVQINRHLKFKAWVKAWVKDAFRNAPGPDREMVKAWVKAIQNVY